MSLESFTRRTLAAVLVASALFAGCGGGSDDSKGGNNSADAASNAQSAGDSEYIDPFQNSPGGQQRCFTKGEVKRAIRRISANVENPERRKRAIETVRNRAC